VVLAASYEAKAYGVEAGMPGWRAKRLCPDLTFVGGNFRHYQRLADQVMDVFVDFTPVVERISIDEAFLDVSGAVHLFGAPASIAAAIRRRVRDEIGLAVSVGVATTKHLAKVASQVAKPDGLVVVPPGEERAFLDPLPIGLMWGVGPVTRGRLNANGIRTIGELAAVSPDVVQGLLGQVVGGRLAGLAVNADPRGVTPPGRGVSMGAQAALGLRDPTDGLLAETLGYLADRVASRLRAAGRAGRTMTVRVRFARLRSVTRSVTVPVPVSSTRTLAEIADSLVRTALTDHPEEAKISLLAISVSKLVDDPVLQLELALGLDDRWRAGDPVGAARWSIDRSIDAIRQKFGRDAVGYATVVFSDEGRVPDEFRELAEH
jgi:DNA polymerase-4